MGPGVAEGRIMLSFPSSDPSSGVTVGGSEVNVTVAVGDNVGVGVLVVSAVPHEIRKAIKKMAKTSGKNVFMYLYDLVIIINSDYEIGTLIYQSIISQRIGMQMGE